MVDLWLLSFEKLEAAIGRDRPGRPMSQRRAFPGVAPSRQLW